MATKSAKPVQNSKPKAQQDSASLRAAFMRYLTQTLKTKTGAVQTAVVKRIFHLAVRDVPDVSLARINLALDYALPEMQPAYYVSVAEAVIGKMLDTRSRRNSNISGEGRVPIVMRESIQSVLAKVRRPLP